MFERQAIMRPKRQGAQAATASALHAPSAPEAQAGTPSPGPAAGFDFGSISILPPEPQTGPEGGAVSPTLANRIREQQGGTPLEPPVRQRMEGTLGHTFADVRVHADDTAADLSRGVGASAFTYSRDIFLGREARGAGARADNRVLAHEL